MEQLDAALAASFETAAFLDHFNDLLDHRQSGKVTYPLDEILLLSWLAVLAGAEGFTDIARFGERKLGLLRRLRPFADGTPSHDHLGDIFATLDAQAFRRCFVAWVAALTRTPVDRHRRQDVPAFGQEGIEGGHPHGLGLRRATTAGAGANQGGREGERDCRHSGASRHAVDRWGGRHHRRDGMPARDCEQDHRQEGHYILALKGNQGRLREDVELFANEQKAKGFPDTTVSGDETVDGDHGRIETRRVTVVHDVAWLKDRHDWPGLKGLIIVESAREIGMRTERETRYYLTSSAWRADRLGPMVRDHWAVENGLHWVMDMTFRDDECRIRTDLAPENFVALKHMAANIARKAPGRDSLRPRLKTAAWDDDYLAKLCAA